MTTAPGQLPASPPSGSATYEVRTAGHLDQHWSARFGNCPLLHNDDGSTTLTVEVADQAHLHGVLAGIRDMGVLLLSLHVVDASDCSGPDAETARRHRPVVPLRGCEDP